MLEHLSHEASCKLHIVNDLRSAFWISAAHTEDPHLAVWLALRFEPVQYVTAQKDHRQIS